VTPSESNTAYVLVLVCGLRKGEVLGLTRDDVDLDTAELVVGRHARFSITMEIYTQVSSKSTREALKRLGDSLDG
jgi:integrase